jgi:hypothetical protein
MSMNRRRARRTPSDEERPTPALRFSLFGFPIQADASFLLITAMLGFGLPKEHLLIWIGVAALAVLFHELGHAFAARSLGGEARIELAGLGGLTHWRTEGSLSRPQRAFEAVSTEGTSEAVSGTAGEAGTKSALSRHQVEILRKCLEEQPVTALMVIAGRADRTKFRNQVLGPLLAEGLLSMTIPDKPRSSKQRYRTTEAGLAALKQVGGIQKP